jgi:hypothetical protein
MTDWSTFSKSGCVVFRFLFKSKGLRFESRPMDRVFKAFSKRFPSPVRGVPKTGHNHFPPRSPQLISPKHCTIRCCIARGSNKVKLSRYAMQEPRRERQLLHIPDFGTRWGPVISVTPRPSFVPGTNWIGYRVGLRAGLNTG